MGDKRINRAAAAGDCEYLFGGKRYLLEQSKAGRYGVRINRATGEASIVVLLR